MPTLHLFTDFGFNGPYVGQMKSAILGVASQLGVIDLMHDAPRFDPRASAYLLGALIRYLPADAVVCAVVDPGVGSARRAVAVHADGRWFVGPDNGLLGLVTRWSTRCDAWRLPMSGAESATFHGRDLFAPAAARLALTGEPLPDWSPTELLPCDWPDDLLEVIYVDGYGNAMTGLRACSMGDGVLTVSGRKLPAARTFSDVPSGSGLWYENSIGLVEIAINQGSAAQALDLQVGSAVQHQPEIS